MTCKYFTIIWLLVANVAVGQINMADSTAQVISYWDKNEKQNYSVSLEKIRIKGADTTSKEMMTYDIEATVLDAGEKSYTVQWLYKNLYSSNPHPAAQKIIDITKDLKVIYKTDELGVFKEVVNWKEVKDYIQGTLKTLQKDYKNSPEVASLLQQFGLTYSTREAIESAAIRDIQQFHTFHGAKYTLGEVLEGKFKVPNLVSGGTFDSDYTLYLDEINEADNNFIVRATQVVNQQQLADATFQYLSTMAKNLKVDPPKREALNDLKNEILTASRIHGTGWVVYSIQTTTINSGDATNIEERIIEIK